MEGLIQLVNEMKVNAKKPKFNELYQNFIQSVANHMSIVAPFIPALTMLMP
jgi:hypothetical protein